MDIWPRLYIQNGRRGHFVYHLLVIGLKYCSSMISGVIELKESTMVDLNQTLYPDSKWQRRPFWIYWWWLIGIQSCLTYNFGGFERREFIIDVILMIWTVVNLASRFKMASAAILNILVVINWLQMMLKICFGGYWTQGIHEWCYFDELSCIKHCVQIQNGHGGHFEYIILIVWPTLLDRMWILWIS